MLATGTFCIWRHKLNVSGQFGPLGQLYEEVSWTDSEGYSTDCAMFPQGFSKRRSQQKDCDMFYLSWSLQGFLYPIRSGADRCERIWKVCRKLGMYWNGIARNCFDGDCSSSRISVNILHVYIRRAVYFGNYFFFRFVFFDFCFPALLFSFSAFCYSAFPCFSAFIVLCFFASLLCFSASPLFCFSLLFCFSSFFAFCFSLLLCLFAFLLICFSLFFSLFLILQIILKKHHKISYNIYR